MLPQEAEATFKRSRLLGIRFPNRLCGSLGLGRGGGCKTHWEGKVQEVGETAKAVNPRLITKFLKLHRDIVLAL